MLVPHDLVEAAALGDIEAIRAWAGDIDARASHPQLPAGCTLLMAACSAGQHQIASLLIERGANVNLHASGGITALLFAVLSGDVTTVTKLLEANARLDAVELEKKERLKVAQDGTKTARRIASQTHTPLELAEANKHVEIASLLRAEASRRRQHEPRRHRLHVGGHRPEPKLLRPAPRLAL